ncbi:MAG: hypothetical protein H0V86_04325 [Chloroflexia bacterium]|nr:hypothetical protein [Chloroflexia bacterium]
MTIWLNSAVLTNITHVVNTVGIAPVSGPGLTILGLTVVVLALFDGWHLHGHGR